MADDTTIRIASRELWETLALALTDPFHRDRTARLGDPSLRRRAVAAAAYLREGLGEVEPGPAERPVGDLDPEGLFVAFDSADGDLESAYRSRFGFSASSACPPCEMEYEPNDDVTFRAQRWADLSGFYRAFGVRPRRKLGERLDHAGTESEFYAFLGMRELAALRDGDAATVAICADARRAFFREHLGWWLPAFGKLLSASEEEGFYREVGRFAGALACTERGLLGMPPFGPPPDPKPARPEPEGCMACAEGVPS